MWSQLETEMESPMHSDFVQDISRPVQHVAFRRRGRALVKVVCALAIGSLIALLVVRGLGQPDGREQSSPGRP